MKIIQVAMALTISMLLAGTPVQADRLQLSKRTAEKYSELKDHVSDANQSVLVANIILAFVPFTPLLGGVGPVTPIEIAVTDFAALGEASANINAIFRNQLKQYCQFEALAQNNSAVDYKFWLDLADSFDGKKTFFPGSWESRDGPDIIKALFSEPARQLTLKVNGIFSGAAVPFDVTGLVILSSTEVSFDLKSGEDSYKCRGVLISNRVKLTLTCKESHGETEVTTFDRVS